MIFSTPRSMPPRSAFGRPFPLVAIAISAFAVAAPAGALPSATIGRPALVSPAAAEAAFPTLADGTSTSTLSTTAYPNEVIELARALGSNVDEIYDFVRNYVDTTFIFGAQKGALGAIVDKSGTPFDQAQLMVNLLRQSGYAANYQLGTITLTGADFQAWTKITNAQAACDLLASGGIPGIVNGVTSTMCAAPAAGLAGATVSTLTMEHVWVDVVIPIGGSTHYVFDPSYKPYTFTNGANIATAAGLATGQAMTAATGSGYTTGTATSLGSSFGFVKGLNAAGLNTTLGTYASNLQNYIQSTMPAGKIIDLVGGREITRYVPTAGTPGLRQTSLPYSASTATRTWTGNIPDQFRTLLTINITKANTSGTYTSVVTDQKVFIDDVYGRRLIYDTSFQTGNTQSFTGSLKVEADFGPSYTLQTFSNTDTTFYSIGTVTLAVNHPYPADAGGSTAATGTYMDTVFSRDHIRFSTPFVIVHGWGETSRGLVDKWGSRTDSMIPFMPANGCETCVSAYHSGKGDRSRERLAASWLVQSSKAGRLHAWIGKSVYTNHHSIGIAHGDTEIHSVNVTPHSTTPTWNYSIAESFDRFDVETGFSVTSMSSNAADRRAVIHSIAATQDALEGSISAQITDLPDTSSTATRFEWGNAPVAADDPSGSSGSIGARRFYRFTQGNASAIAPVQGLLLVEGKLTTTNPEMHGGTDPIIGPGETSARQSTVANLVSTYAAQGFDVIGSEEAFLGPGQRGGFFTAATTNPTYGYTHQYSKQRGGAFVATLYDPTSGDPIQIAHIVANIGAFGAVGIKGGGGGAQPQHQASYDPSQAADILKSKFVDRSKAVGVDLESGNVTYSSPASLSVGSGEFPYSLSASLIWRGGEVQSSIYGPISHVAPTTPWTTNWNNSIAVSGSGLEAMGETDIRASAGTIAAFLAMQDIYRSPVSPQREVAAVLAGAWWTHQITGNVVTANVGADTRQFLKKADGTWFLPGPGGYATLAQAGTRVVYTQPKCGGGYDYVLTRGWNYAGVSFTVTNTHGDQQNFNFWSTDYEDGSATYCAFLHGFRLTSWTFPFGVSVNLTYQASAANQVEDLVLVNNSLGRRINLASSGLGGFDNGLTGTAARSVVATPMSATVLAGTHTDPAGVATSFSAILSGGHYLLSSVLVTDDPALPTVATKPAIAYGYDTLGHVSTAQDAVALQQPGTRNAYSFYFAAGARADRRDPANGLYSIINDLYRHPLGIIDELGNSTSVTHDGRGRVTGYTFPEGNQETLAYDDRNNTTSYTRTPKSGSSYAPVLVSAQWDPTWNKPSQITDAIGCTTTFSYYPANPGASELHNATRCIPATGQAAPVYAFTYNPIGRVLQTTDPTGLVATNVYDPTNGNLLSTTIDPTGGNSRTQFGYDALGNVTSVTDPRLNVTENQYDLDRRPIVVIHHNGTIAAAAMAAERTTYDPLGRKTMEEGGVTFSGALVSTYQILKQTFYTPTSNVDHEKNGAGETTSYSYDPMDRVSIVTDPLGRRVASVYDLAGHALFTWRGWDSATPPVASTPWVPSGYAGSGRIRYAAYTYSPNGNQIAVLDANNNQTLLAYDGHDRLAFLMLPDSTGAVCTPGATDNTAPSCPGTAGNPNSASYEQYRYIADGTQSSIRKRDNQVIAFIYDQLGRQTKKDLPGTTTGDVYTNYDAAGRPLSVLFGDPVTGTGVAYTYDSAKRVVTESTFGRTLTYGYDIANNRIQETWPDAFLVNYDFDAMNRMWRVRENNATTGVGVLVTYTLDPLSRRQGIARGNLTSTSYTYDPASRLASLTQDVTGTTQDISFGFGYTAAGQLQLRTASNSLYSWARTPASTSYTPDALNRYANVAGTSYGYDGRGNLTSDGLRTFTYDVENHLTLEVGGAGLALSYDPLGRLWQTVSGATTTQFLYDGARLVGEYSTGGTVLRRYVHGSGVDEPVVWYEGPGTADRRWFHGDERGSVIATTDGSGAATVYNYGPYGEPSTWAGSRFRYTGQIALPEASLYHYKARVYDPKLGRFLQTDPIGSKDDLNLYTYVGNDPLDRTDPSGRAGCDNSVSKNDCATLMQNQSKALADVRSVRSAIGRIEKGGTLSAGDATVKAAVDKVFGSTSNSTLGKVDSMLGKAETVLADKGANYNYHSPSAREITANGVPSNAVAYTSLGAQSINILPSYYAEPAWHQEGTLIHEPTHIFGTVDNAYRFGPDSALTHGWSSYLPWNWNDGLNNADSYAAFIVGH